MTAAQQTRLDEWLLGSTILCKSCGCIWLVPVLQTGESYECRQCGSAVERELPTNHTPESVKTRATVR